MDATMVPLVTRTLCVPNPAAGPLWSSWPTRSGTCWCRLPPQATLSIWGPRQRAGLGAGQRRRVPLGRVDISFGMLGRTVDRRVDASPAGDDNAVKNGYGSFGL